MIGMGIDDALAHCLLGRFGPSLAFDYADSGRNMAVRSFLTGHGASRDDDHVFELRDGLVDLSSVMPPPHVTVIDETGRNAGAAGGLGAAGAGGDSEPWRAAAPDAEVPGHCPQPAKASFGLRR